MEAGFETAGCQEGGGVGARGADICAPACWC